MMSNEHAHHDDDETELAYAADDEPPQYEYPGHPDDHLPPPQAPPGHPSELHRNSAPLEARPVRSHTPDPNTLGFEQLRLDGPPPAPNLARYSDPHPHDGGYAQYEQPYYDHAPTHRRAPQEHYEPGPTEHYYDGPSSGHASFHSATDHDAASLNSYATASSFAPQTPFHPPAGHRQQQPPYDPLYAAASSVLGDSPYPQAPTPAPQGSVYYDDGSSYSSPHPQSYSQSPSLPNNPYLPSRQTTLSTYSAGSSSQSLATAEFEMRRPPLDRDDTFSIAPSTRRGKAVDVNHPPYTRQYIEEYRQRIKGDPDPEAHFRYAKYLIEAAKKVGANASDQKAVKRYRDSLISESLKVIRRLATQGDAYPEAQFFLANCHGTGILGLQIDHERAYHLYLQAAKQNHPSASYRVAVCNEIGAGTRRDAARAFAFYRKAASLGDTPAMYKLGMILLVGALGQAKNPREAIGWLKRAAEQADEENPHALHELGLLHEIPNSNIVVHDDAYARELFTRAANLGYTQSQFKLGQCYEFGSVTCPTDPRRSIAWYSKAAEKGDPEAELALSGWYLTGSEGVLKQSDSEAYLWARRAANKGLSKAEYAVGYYAEVGIGVKQDMELAKRWYMRAAAQGNKRAMARLTELKREGNKKRAQARPTRQQANKEECIIS